MSVFEVCMQEVQGGLFGEGAVGFLGIVPDEPGGELPIESAGSDRANPRKM